MPNNVELYRQTPNAKFWSCKVYDADAGKIVRLSTHQRDEKLAAKEAQRLALVHSTPRRLSEKTTLTTALENLILFCQENDKAAKTIEMYRNSAGHILRILGESTKLATITGATVDEFISQRLRDNAHRKNQGRHSIHKDLVCLRMTLRIARRRGEFDLDVDQVMPVRFAKKYEPRERFLTQEEAIAFLAEIAPERRAHVLFVLATGARWGESIRAELSDIDMDRGVVDLRGTKTKLARRTVPMVGHARALLEVVVRDPHIAQTGPMFAHWCSYLRGLSKACVRAGIPKISANDLRRTLPSWFAQAGVDTHKIGKTLGHGDSKMADLVYARLGNQLGTVIGQQLSNPLGERLAAFGDRLARTQPSLLLGSGKATKTPSVASPEHESDMSKGRATDQKRKET